MKTQFNLQQSNYFLLNIFIFFLFFNSSLFSQTTNIPMDVSGMFNERGFLKSGYVSPDEGEIINNFNGNLCYTFPIYALKGPGDINIELSLNYNGSINYQLIAATRNYLPGNTLPRYNFSAPGWILSLNGMAIQMLNFETNFFSPPNANNKVENSKAHFLATGYHLTDNLKAITSGENDIITLMRGDGSVVYLKRISNTCSSDNNYAECYIGEYYVKGIGDYSRARVEYIEAGSQPTYRNRRVSFMKGDGLTYIYEEYKNGYADFPYNATSSFMFKPQVFLLKSIKDRFGNNIQLIYDYSINYENTYHSIYGRPIIKSIQGSWQGSGINFNYYINPSLAVTVSNNNRLYKILCNNQQGNFDSLGNHRFYPSSLINPLNDSTKIDHLMYSRYADSLNNPIPNLQPMEVVLNNDQGLKRLVRVQNTFKGIREYTYADSGIVNVSINMAPAENENICSRTKNTNYFGQGRDLFFVNMVGSKIVYDGGTLENITSYKYFYGTTRNWIIHPIDETDIYNTNILTINPQGKEINETPSSKGMLIKFKNYKIDILSNVHQEYPDWLGHTKLFETLEYIGDTNTVVKRTMYKFESNLDQGTAKSSFLDTAIVEVVNNIEKRINFVYGYFTSPIQNETYKNPVQSILQIDNYGLKTLFNNTFLYDSSAHYVNARYKANSSLSEQEGDTTYFYLINQPTSKRVYLINQNSLLYQDSARYLRTNSDTGYMGQVIQQRVYDVADTSYFKDIYYSYYVRDTVGRFLYTVDNTKPSNEGKLKSVTDARGNPVKFYYHPVYTTEYQTDDISGRPKIDFLIINADGTVENQSQVWEDIRMPVITQYSTGGSNSLFMFNKYDPSGKMYYSFNDNKYLNQLMYDRLERIIQVNLPYDFGQPQYTVLVDTIYENIEVDLKADLVSSYDFVNNDTKFYTKYDNECSPVLQYGSMFDLFHLYVLDPGGPPTESLQNQKRDLPLIRFFNQDFFRTLSAISNAQLKIYPKNFNRNTDGDTSLSKVQLYIKPLKQMYETSNSIVFTESNLGSYYYAYSFMNSINDCITYFENDFDVTNLLNTHIFTNHDSVIAFKIDAKPVYSTVDPPPQEYFMDFYPNLYTCQFPVWCANASPVLHISGIKKTIRYDTILTYQNYSSKFSYNNYGKAVLTELKYTNQSTGKKEILFDGFYRVKQSRLYTSQSSFDSVSVKYNYLNLKLNSKDGRENLTKYSYNQYFNPSKTENPDASYTLISETYINGYSYTFGNIPGMIVKKVLTDETGNNFEKYYDAVGNLRREIKYVEGIPSDNLGEVLIPLITDYKYDDLYRVIEVKTPNDKYIYHSYDGFSRQSSRTTPDAGLVKYKYDKNDNLRFSQDNNQANKPTERPPARYITYRGYDGLNRLLYIGDSYNESYLTVWSNLNPDIIYDFENYNLAQNNFLVINVYDTLTNYPANANIFSERLPADYYTLAPRNTNNTKGSLCATAYRTLGTDEWSFKYYRYDTRGRVIKMWNYIAGLGEKSTEYSYNSQNQITDMKYENEDVEGKEFKYEYDYAGRLQNTSVDYIPSNTPENYLIFNSYSYNQNSQINTFTFDPISLTYTSEYDTRNRITIFSNEEENPFSYSLEYFANSNIQSQTFSGYYKDNFSNQYDLSFNYSYDESNRLLEANCTSTQDNTFDLINSYDPDGNILTMQRYGSNNNLFDNYNYAYYAGTNRLRIVSGSTNQFTYDYNGNMTNDYMNNNTGIKYDHRNLITEITKQNLKQDPPTTYITRYRYDEAGNRTRKTVFLSNEYDPPPLPDDEADLPPGWTIIVDDYYSRDVSGKEIGVYSSYTLQYWNVWSGGEITGRINYENNSRYYYLKDHLGSVRAVIDEDKKVISAQDYDAWGYYLENRMYEPYTTKSKFTGKERDSETSYDYFGARYYDSRVGRWGQVEPLYDKFIGITPYGYGLLNAMKMVDVNGKDVIVSIDGTNVTVTMTMYYTTSEKYGFSFNTNENLNILEKYLDDARSEWNEAANEYNSENKYQIKFEVYLIEKSNIIFENIPEGENIAFYQKNALEPGIVKGNQFRIVPLETEDFYHTYIKLSPPHTGSHEFGHIIGLTHVGPKDSKEQSESINIMGYNKNRKPPSKEDIQKFINKIELDKRRQIIKGDISTF